MKSSAISDTPYVEALHLLAQTDPDVICVTCSDVAQAQLERSPSRVPQSLITLPEGPSAAVSFCAGLAREGFKPHLHASAVSLTRSAYEVIVSQIAAPRLQVRLIGFDGGLSHEGGVGGQGIEDLSLMAQLPNFTVAEAGDAEELITGLALLNQVDGPVYLRAPLGEAPRLFDGPPSLRRPRVLSEGADLLILSMGVCTAEVLRLTEALKTARVQITHVHLFCLTPAPIDALRRTLDEQDFKGVITLENHLSSGGLGSMMEGLLSQQVKENTPRLIRLGIQGTFAQGGNFPYLLKKYGLDVGALLAAIEQLIKRRVGVSPSDLPPSPWANRSATPPIR
jgi:transketolase